MIEQEIADAVMMEFRDADSTWPGMRGMLAEAARRGREFACVPDDDGIEPIGTESENAGVIAAFLRGRRTVRDLQRRAEAVVPSGSSTRADDPGCVWLRFSAEDAARIEKEGAFVVQDAQPERTPREASIEDLLIAVASPNAWEDSPERKAAWDEIKRRARFTPEVVAENAIGLFVEELHRRGAMVSEAIRPGTAVEAARDAAVAEVVQGVGVEVPPPTSRFDSDSR